jgi:hypothetical protein
MLFLCPFTKAAWFSSPWHIRTEMIAMHNHTIPQMIKALLDSNHPHINITRIYTFLWCMWKARNDALFGSKFCKPSQVYLAANAILQGSKIEEIMEGQQQSSGAIAHDKTSLQEPPCSTGHLILCDAAWTKQDNMQSSPAGIGVIIQLDGNQHCRQIHVAAMSPLVSSPLQAEAYGLLLATKLADSLRIQQPHFYTDCSVLASAAASTSIFKESGHWNIRPIIASIQASSSFKGNKVTHINRCYNIKAHHQAKLATKISNRQVALRCLSSDTGPCSGTVSISQVWNLSHSFL